MSSLANEWESVKLSVNLVDFTLQQLDFLSEINRLGNLYEGDFFNRALYRYESYWLSFYSEKSLLTNEDIKCLIPPMDVSWIWHLHMLAPPVDYQEDCVSVCGKALDDNNDIYCGRDERLRREQITRKLWESKFKASYDYADPLKSVDANYVSGTGKRQLTSSFSSASESSLSSNSRSLCRTRSLKVSKIKHDLAKSSKLQRNFFYQISLPHYFDRHYLQHGLDRYKKFLFLRKLNANDFSEFHVPCNLINLLWHSHRLNLREYKLDTKSCCGDRQQAKQMKLTTTMVMAAAAAAAKISEEESGELDDLNSDVEEEAEDVNGDTFDMNSLDGGDFDMSKKQLHLPFDENSCMNQWQHVFNEKFFFSGSMYRGVMPSKEYFSVCDIDYEPYLAIYRRFSLIDFKLFDALTSEEINFDDENFSQYEILVFKRNVSNNNRRNEKKREDEEYCDLKDIICLNKINNYRLNNDSPLQICLNFFNRKDSLKSIFSHFHPLHRHHHHHHHHKDARGKDEKTHDNDEHQKHENFINHFNRSFKLRKKSLFNYWLHLKIPEDLAEEIQEFQVNLNEKAKFDFLLKLKFHVSFSLSKGVELHFRRGSFEYVDMNRINFIYKEFYLIDKDFSNGKGQAINAVHEVFTKSANEESTIYFIETLHIISLKWTSLRVISNEKKVLATSHLIDSDNLPGKSLVSTKQITPVITLDTKFEKAMLVRNIDGDHSIVKGKWFTSSSSSSTAPTTSRRRSQRLSSTSSVTESDDDEKNHLIVEIFYFHTRHFERLEIKKSTDFELRSYLIDCIVDLKSGNIFVKFNTRKIIKDANDQFDRILDKNFNKQENLQISSLLAVAFSICVLYVLLEPKRFIGQTNPNKSQQAEGSKPEVKRTESMNANCNKDQDDYVLLDSVGLLDLLQNNWFLNSFKKNEFSIDQWVFNEIDPDCD